MIDGLTDWLADPAARSWYLAFCVTLLVAPMAALSAWYHTRIRRTPGGRALMRRQGKATPRRFNPKLGEGLSMARDIHAGRYGARAKALQRTVYWACGVWLAALALAFGLLLYADEANRAAGP